MSHLASTLVVVAVVAFLVHPTRSDASEGAVDLADWLTANGHSVVVPPNTPDIEGLNRYKTERDRIRESADLGVALGGDGTVMRAVRLLADGGAPILGVNYGHLGYLTEVEPDQAKESIQQFFDGGCEIESRMRVSVKYPDGSCRHALNEVVVEKIDSGHTVSLAVSIDGQPFHTYLTDGVIVATPTGSTAYSLSARGPLVDPTHRALIFTPVAPHTLFDRSMVLRPGAEVSIEVVGRRAANVVVDGKVGSRIERGQSAVVTAAPDPAKFVNFGSKNFHEIIKSKFDLNER